MNIHKLKSTMKAWKKYKRQHQYDEDAFKGSLLKLHFGDIPFREEFYEKVLKKAERAANKIIKEELESIEESERG